MLTRSLSSLAVALLVAALPVRGADPALKDMSPDYIKAMQGAMRSFQSRDFKTALAMVDKAEGLQQPTAMSINIRAAVAIEEKRFPEGREYCLKALQLDPKFFPAVFNLAEIPFMQGKYTEARLGYEKLMDDESSSDLVKFRIFLTYLLEKNDVQAKEHLDKIPLLNDTPIYFYANAAWEFVHGNEKEAHSFVKSAEAVFPASKVTNFADVMYDLGWLKRAEAPSE
jgi:tetratricopeptide (TPR) repeat protein